MLPKDSKTTKLRGVPAPEGGWGDAMRVAEGF